ncbi:uncharacterized protein LOC126897851 [Daktulosphaira vitifoliae]|uniref:uncharacterized protein LOC126897851 n=1 Tax=Daktulosphaira vitifoliae TaxID=58002 RepID=UPI0021AA0F6B|nr:uncharacterized protein LOC126897851 [Daktulosphaira vitifoliae]XP_050527734.1 uncharacterized protein LOC126897851 [Daktulosphaira vitifoliae]
MKKDKKKHKDKTKKNEEPLPSPEECTPGCSSMDCMGLQQIPPSPPPSYKHSLAERQSLEQGQMMIDEENYAAAGNCNQKQCIESEQDHENNVSSPVRQEIFHKSSKEFYKAVAAQWGITCKMSDHCRCLDCQSRYFDCEYDQDNEQEKTDGGLGAGTPMFLSEMMHTSTCTLI